MMILRIDNRFTKWQGTRAGARKRAEAVGAKSFSLYRVVSITRESRTLKGLWADTAPRR